MRNRQNAVRAAMILAVTIAAAGAFVWNAAAAEGKSNAIKDAMKAFNKAPKGIDPICKKA